MTIAGEYAEFCANVSLTAIPDEVSTYAKRLVLDTVGIMIGAESRVESSPPIRDAITELDGSGSGATVLATGEQMTPANAAFLNGAMAHSLDYDDTHRGASLHPGAPVIAAAVAAAEQTNATGDELLTGIITGYEITARLGMAVNAASHYSRGFHGTGTCGVFGGTAAAGVIHNLTATEFENAFGLNGSQASGSLQFLSNGAWNKRLHPGFSARDAITSVTLAKQGVKGAAAPIEGENGFFTGYTDDPIPARATSGLGDEFETLMTGIKPYPCCRYMHPALDLLLAAYHEDGVDLTEVTSITINLPSPGITLVKSPADEYPASFVDAQFSMRFGAALALTTGEAGVDSFISTVEAPYSARFTELYSNTEVTPADDIDAAYPEEWAARVTLHTESETTELFTENARGEPENKLSDAEVFEKFTELTERLDAGDRTELRERLINLEDYTIEEILSPVQTHTDLASKPT